MMRCDLYAKSISQNSQHVTARPCSMDQVIAVYLNPPHFLKDILHILNVLYITSVPREQVCN